MADWNNQGPFRFMNFRERVPDALRFPLYIFYLIAFQFSNGFYFTAMAQLSGERALTSEDTEMLGCAVLTGCAFFFPLAFRLKFRFTNKTSLTTAAAGMALVNILFPHVHSLPLMVVLACLGGFCRLYGTFEVFSNILPKITPTYNYGVFLSFVFFIVIGCVQIFDWAAIQIIYYYNWEHVHLTAIGLCLSVILIVQLSMRHFRPQPKAPLWGIDWMGMMLWGVFILSAIFVVVYGERFNWLTNDKIRIGLGVSLVALSLGLIKMKVDENAFIQPGAFTCPNIWGLLLLFLCFDILLASQTVLQNTFMDGVLGWGQTTTAQLKIFEFLGGLAAALFFWVTRTFLHWRLKLHTFLAMGSMVLYCWIMTRSLSPSLSLGQMYLPSLVIGFAHVAIFISLTVYAQAYCNFKYYFQVLCVLGFVRMGIGDAIGAAIWKRALTAHAQLEHLSFTGSLRELYGWAVVFGVVVIIAILCSTFDRLRNPYPTMKQAYIILIKKLSKMNKLTILIALIATSLSTSAQKTFALDDLFLLAEQNAKRILISEEALSAAKEEVAAAKTQRLPEIGAQLSVGYNGRGLITDRNFSNAMNIYIPEFANNFSLQVSQVIYSGGAISNKIRLSEMGQKMAELDIERNRQEVRFYIAGQYLDMMKTLSTIEVVEQNIALAQQLIKQMQARVEQGAALSNDLTRYELLLENLKLQRRKLSDIYTIQNHSLCQTLSLPEDTKILPDQNLLSENLSTEEELYWQQNAIDNSALRQAELASKMAKEKVQLLKSSRRPSVALIAQDNLNGPVTIEIPALNKNFNYWFVGLGVQYDLSSLYKSRNKIRRAQFEQKQAYLQLALAQEQMNTSIHSAHTELLTALAELQTCQKQVQLAAENYSVISTRYQNDLALVTDLIDASNAKLSAEISKQQANINIIYCRKKLEYLCGRL